MNFRIVRSLYPTNPQPKAMTNEAGQLDFLGQILAQMHKPLEKDNKYFKSPADTKETIFPFTCLIRGQIYNSEVTLAILRLPQNRSGEAALQRILSEFSISLTFIDGTK